MRKDVISELFFGQPSPVAVVVKFQMAYRDWLKFEASDAWKLLLESLEDDEKSV